MVKMVGNERKYKDNKMNTEVERSVQGKLKWLTKLEIKGRGEEARAAKQKFSVVFLLYPTEIYNIFQHFDY